MPLPKPKYPTYVPKSFISPEERKLSDTAIGLYAKYHPAAMQQALYQSILADEQFQAKQGQAKLQMLMDERDTLLRNLSRFRESGLGPLGRQGKGTKSTTRGSKSGDLLDFYADMGSIEQRRRESNQDNGVANTNIIETRYSPHPQHNTFINSVLALLEPTDTADQVTAKFALAARDNFTRLMGNIKVEQPQARAGATRLYQEIAGQFPGMFQTSAGVPTERGKMLAKKIDQQFTSGGHVFGSLLSGQDPGNRLQLEKQAALTGVTQGVGPGFFEKAAQAIPLDANGDGVVSDEERSFAKEQEERRKALGIAEPLTDEEQVFLSRYIDALRDDGVATREELGADYDAGKAAYEKARRADVAPRGFGPFFDPTYLTNLQRLSGLDERISAITDRESPGVLAARGALGLPQVPQEALNAAAQISPLAAEALPYAMKRVGEAGGAVTPRGGAEKFAQRFIDTDAGARDFNGLVQAVNKRYPNDPVSRREALAYYGAHYYQQDQKGQTLQQGMIDMNVPQAVTESQQFVREVVPQPVAPQPVEPPPFLPDSAPVDFPMDEDYFLRAMNR